jgi:GTP-binding protein HflX
MARGWTAENAPAPDQEPRSLSTRRKPELAILAAALPRKDPRLELPVPLDELAMLADTAGVRVHHEHVVQRRDRLDSATCVGKGTVTRIGELIEQNGADVVIFDNDLSPGQRRNLEKRLEKKVIDRTELILDIFASHARTPQARLQVEVAQLEYSLPRLRRMWSHLDPGIGLRGPGEKQLEIDRRLVRLRIQELKRELAKVRARKEREVAGRAEAFCVALVGYTNAGKSTLMNRLTTSDVFVADQLFATLDTRTRPWKVANRRTVLLSDTVGFIRHLPHHLVESFHATLEEVVTADLLLHVVDSSDPAPLEQVKAVREVLSQLGLQERPELVVLNKIDACEREFLPYLEKRLTNTIRVSALSGEGIEDLRKAVNERAAADEVEADVELDVREGKAISLLEGFSEVLSKRLEGETLHFKVQCHPRVLGGIRARLQRPDGMRVEGGGLGDETEDAGGW